MSSAISQELSTKNCLSALHQAQHMTNSHLQILQIFTFQHSTEHAYEPRQLLTKHCSEKSDNLVTRHPLNPISVKPCTLQPIDTHHIWRRNQLPQTQLHMCQWRLCTIFNSTGVQALSIQCCGPVGCRGKWPRQADLVNGKTVPTWCFQSQQSITSYCQIPELCLCLTLWCLAWPTTFSDKLLPFTKTALELQCSADHTAYSILARVTHIKIQVQFPHSVKDQQNNRHTIIPCTMGFCIQ